MLLFCLSVRVSRPLPLSLSLARAHAGAGSAGGAGSRLFSSEPLRILYLGSPSVSSSVLLHLHSFASAHPQVSIVGVVSLPSKPRDRNKITPTPVSQTAASLSLPLFTPSTLKKSLSQSFYSSLPSFNLAVTCAYGLYLPRPFLSLPKHGTINLHPSLLPLYRGAAPVQRQLCNGESTLGTSLLYTVSSMDAGPMIWQGSEPNDFKSGASLVLDNLMMKAAHRLTGHDGKGEGVLDQVLNGSMSFNKAVEQNHDLSTHAKIISKEEGRINFNTMTAEQVTNRLLGFEGWPGTTVSVRLTRPNAADDEDMVLGVTQVEVQTFQDVDEEAQTNGEIVFDKFRKAFKVGCKDRSLRIIQRVKPAGKKEMDARSFFNGLRGGRIYPK